MGFLDDLKKQAGNLQAQQEDAQQVAARNTLLVEAAAKTLRSYLLELASNLDVIRPAPKVRYVLDKRLVLDSLPRQDFRFDARRKILRDVEVIDHVFVVGMVRGPRDQVLAKDFVNEMEALERRLGQAAIFFRKEPVRHAADSRLLEMRYLFDADLQVSTRVLCDHDRGRLRFALRNLDGLESVDCEFPAHEITQARLDDLARWWVGEPNRFLEGALELRRTEAR
ncbi:MAG: hypothetical protein U1F50_01180 [Rubrivivax sp.]